MTSKLIFALSVSLLLTGCSPITVNKKPPQNTPSSDASIKLAEAANAVSRSLIELAKIEKESKPKKKKDIINVSSFNMQVRASIDWSGPIEELLDRLAKANFYRLRILGTRPAIPVLISLTSQDEQFGDIFRNIDYLSGDKADIQIYPKQKIVELRYAKM